MTCFLVKISSEMGIRSKQWLFLLQLILFLLNAHLSIAADTISAGQSLSRSQTIISQGGKFELGFFTPGNSKHYYIGIWFKNISKQTVVWVANRDKPLPENSSKLKMSKDGNLALFNSSNIQIWSTNSESNTSNSTVAVLLDSGNLILRERSNSSVVIWQSFDHPTDTWLPGGKLGLNKVTGEVQALTSWRNLEDPSPGIFSLEIDRNGSSEYFFYWNRSHRYWGSGVWTGQIFGSVPELMGSIFSFRFVSNEMENYFTYFFKDSVPIYRTVIDFTGQLKAMFWIENTQDWVTVWALPSARCENYSLCGAFGSCYQDSSLICQCIQGFEPRSWKDWNLRDWSGGCVRKTQLQCGKNNSVNEDKDGHKDGFLMVPNMGYPKNPQSLAVENDQECELACLNNCLCTAYAFGNGCTTWNGDLFNLRQFSGENLYLRLVASELPKSRRKEQKVIVVIFAAVAGGVAALGFNLLLIWSCRKRRTIKKLKAFYGSLVPFSYRELQTATKNFSEILGHGGFGCVFKGTLPDLTDIAVKKLEGITQGEKQFRAEVSTLGMIQHVNLVCLRGFCSEGTERLLVYDYMPNGSLASHLFHKDSVILDWKTRYQIAIGTARGLAYLHEETRECIIHCDIKPENILLDASFCPKVADFGLAKLLGRKFSRVLTTIRGTRGYLAPEWISGLAVTTKADVYSYGKMLLEVISGRRNSQHSEDGKWEYFPILAAEKISEGDVLSLLDYKLEGNANLEDLSRACRVACWCIQDDENHRPSMRQVIQFLEGILEVRVPPIPRCLQFIVDDQETTLLNSKLPSDRSFQVQSGIPTTF